MSRINSMEYVLLENNCLNIFEKEINKSKCYEIVDKVELDINELEFISNKELVVFSYDINIVDDLEILNNEEYVVVDDYDKLIIIIEEERLLYMFMNNNYIVKSVEVKDVLNYL